MIFYADGEKSQTLDEHILGVRECADSGNVLLRREQYRVADRSESTAVIAANMLVGKLANARAVLRRARRERLWLVHWASPASRGRGLKYDWGCGIPRFVWLPLR